MMMFCGGLGRLIHDLMLVYDDHILDAIDSDAGMVK